MTELTVERVFSDPPLSGTTPISVSILPKGEWVAYLANPPDARERLDLYGYHCATQSARRLVDSSALSTIGTPPTDEEKAQRERRRQFASGISSFCASPDGRAIAFLADGAVYIHDMEQASTRRLSQPGERQTDLKFSSTGGNLSYVRDGNLFRYVLGSEREHRLTNDASATITNGLAEFIAQEEMHRFDGHWWTPDERRIVYARVDSSPVPIVQRYEFDAAGLRVFAQRYPRAGAPNAIVELRVLDLQDGSTQPLHWVDHPEDYLARVTIGQTLIAVQVQARDQRSLILKLFSFDGRQRAVALTESSSTWINLHDNMRFLPGTDDFVWTSERSGNTRLYLYRDGAARELTTLGRVARVVCVNDAEVFFLGWQDTPTEQHLYAIRFDGRGGVRKLTNTPGWHDAVVEPGGTWFVDLYASVQAPPAIRRVVRGTEAPTEWIARNQVDANHPYAPFAARHASPRFGELRSADGQTLHYRLTVPPDFDEAVRYPAIIHVYGGPGVQRVVDDWPPLTLQLLARSGYVVFELDNRGSGNREPAFEAPIHLQLGRAEVEDQLIGLCFLESQPWIDTSRIAVFGHSYGGFMTLMCLAAAGRRLRAGVSVAPVTDWTLYDTHYTERYLSTPELNPDGYARSAVANHLDGIAGRLLLIHGMADDNVLFDNSSMLMKLLQRRRIAFELMLYPGAKHALQERDVAIHRFDTILDFLRRSML